MFNNYKFKPYQLYFRHTANYYVISAAKIIKNANKCKKNNVQKLCILRKTKPTVYQQLLQSGSNCSK